LNQGTKKKQPAAGLLFKRPSISFNLGGRVGETELLAAGGLFVHRFIDCAAETMLGASPSFVRRRCSETKHKSPSCREGEMIDELPGEIFPLPATLLSERPTQGFSKLSVFSIERYLTDNIPDPDFEAELTDPLRTTVDSDPELLPIDRLHHPNSFSS
jgi:hypothetical protein